MRRIVTLIAAVALLIPALPAAAGKPVVTDYAEFTWGDGNYIRYDAGVVEVSFTETSYVECAGGMLLQTITLSGTTTGTLEMKNHLRSGRIALDPQNVDASTVGGCDSTEALATSGKMEVVFAFVSGSVERGKTPTGRQVERSGIAELGGAFRTAATGVVIRSAT